jgi:hypothetical protein
MHVENVEIIVISEIYEVSANACFMYEDQITHPANVIFDKFVTEMYFCFSVVN